MVLLAIEFEDQNVPWAADGSNVTLHMTAVDAIHLGIGTVLCPPSDIVPLATTFTARIIVFDVQVPITAGTSVRVGTPVRESRLVSLMLDGRLSCSTSLKMFPPQFPSF